MRSAAGSATSAWVVPTSSTGTAPTSCAHPAPASCSPRGPTGSATATTRSPAQAPSSRSASRPQQRDPRPGELAAWHCAEQSDGLLRRVRDGAPARLPVAAGLRVDTGWSVPRSACRTTWRPDRPTAAPVRVRHAPVPADPRPAATSSLTVPGAHPLLVDGRLLPIGAAKVAGGEFDFTAPRRIGAPSWTRRSARSSATPTAARR